LEAFSNGTERAINLMESLGLKIEIGYHVEFVVVTDIIPSFKIVGKGISYSDRTPFLPPFL
jgi:hypothetical protein